MYVNCWPCLFWVFSWLKNQESDFYFGVIWPKIVSYFTQEKLMVGLTHRHESQY